MLCLSQQTKHLRLNVEAQTKHDNNSKKKKKKLHNEITMRDTQRGRKFTEWRKC